MIDISYVTRAAFSLVAFAADRRGGERGFIASQRDHPPGIGNEYEIKRRDSFEHSHFFRY